jgi:hypothetical protein
MLSAGMQAQRRRLSTAAGNNICEPPRSRRMQLESITFDRVFDIQRWQSSRWGPITAFSFSAAERTVHGVVVAGWPVIQPGMTVTGVLRRGGDWQTVLGWIDHRTGELAVPPHRGPLAAGTVLSILCVLAGTFLYGPGSPLAPGDRLLWCGLFCMPLGLLATRRMADGLAAVRAAKLLAGVPVSHPGKPRGSGH